MKVFLGVSSNRYYLIYQLSSIPSLSNRFPFVIDIKFNLKKYVLIGILY